MEDGDTTISNVVDWLNMYFAFDKLPIETSNESVSWILHLKKWKIGLNGRLRCY